MPGMLTSQDSRPGAADGLLGVHPELHSVKNLQGCSAWQESNPSKHCCWADGRLAWAERCRWLPMGCCAVGREARSTLLDCCKQPGRQARQSQAVCMLKEGPNRPHIA